MPININYKFYINGYTVCYTMGFKLLYCMFTYTIGYTNTVTVCYTHRRSMEKEAKANRRRCFMGENCRAHASIQTV